MRKTVKREAVTSSGGGGGGNGKRSGVDDGERVRAVKREHLSRNGVHASGREESNEENEQSAMNRRNLRSKYLVVKTQINDEKDELGKVDSDKFSTIFNEVENLHREVQKPREQVADAEALLDIAHTLVSSVKSQSNEGITPSEFITCLIRDFGESNGISASTENDQVRIRWKDIGLAVSPIFRKCHGCCTMLGPMSTELKQRKTAVQRKHTRPTESAQPEELDDSGAEEKTDTDKNMSTMFEILRRKKRASLECLILNRKSFAQTVENLFALSFLVKDGRAEISLNENGFHIVSPRNAPAANSIASGEVTYSHFVFRFDFKDWKLMMDVVPHGDELMLHRERSDTSDPSQAVPVASSSRASLPTTPIRKLSRNRGLVIQEDSIVEDSPEIDDDGTRAGAVRKCKRKLH